MTLRSISLLLLALALLAGPAAHAQTKPTTKKMASRHPAGTTMPRKTMTSRPGPNTPKPGDPGISGYAAPGEPINVQDNGKNTPPYDGSAAKARAPKGTTMPKQ